MYNASGDFSFGHKFVLSILPLERPTFQQISRFHVTVLQLFEIAIAQVPFPIFDPGFSEASFGFRMGLSAHDAVYQIRDYIRKGYRVAFD